MAVNVDINSEPPIFFKPEVDKSPKVRSWWARAKSLLMSQR